MRISTILEAILGSHGFSGIEAVGTEVSRLATIFLLMMREIWGVWGMLVSFSHICFLPQVWGCLEDEASEMLSFTAIIGRYGISLQSGQFSLGVR